MGSLYTFPPQKTSRLNIPDDVPVYRIIGKGFFDGEQLREEFDERGRPCLISYPDEPNFNLLPMNELALKNTEAWLEKLKKGADKSLASREYGMRGGVMTHDIEVRNYMARIADSGRFDSQRVQAPILSNNAVKSKAVTIDQVETDSPEIVSIKSRDQASMING